MVKRFIPPTASSDTLIEPILLLSSKFLETEQSQIPDYFWPATGKWRIRGQFPIPEFYPFVWLLACMTFACIFSNEDEYLY